MKLNRDRVINLTGVAGVLFLSLGGFMIGAQIGFLILGALLLAGSIYGAVK